jgi:rod shape-determining protein MreB
MTPRFRLFSNDVGIDLGTANTLIWQKGKGIVLNEPSIVAFDRTTKNIIAIGHEAEKMVGKTHRDIKTIRPLKDGVIADFEIAEGMLRAFIQKASTSIAQARRMVICVPSGITEVEIGVGLDVHEPMGNMVVDIGGGTTEIAVIALSGIVVDESIRIAGDELTNAIVSWFKRQHNILIGDRTAEIIKVNVGSAWPLAEELEIEVKGRDMVTGTPKSIIVSSEEIREALNENISTIIEAVLTLLEKTPPELSADIFDRGIILTGGGALLKGLDERLRRETSLPVHVADDPLTAVARGTGRVLEDLDAFSSVLIKSKRY